jgi:uncharacterized protein YciI
MLILGVARFKPGMQAQHEALMSGLNAHMMQPLNPRIRLAGPLLDDTGAPSGIFMLFEADSIETVRQFAADGPYAMAHLYERIDLDALRLEVGRL